MQRVSNTLGLVFCATLLAGLALPACSMARKTTHLGGLGRTFYVAAHGRDSNRGTSAAHPWRTVDRVNRARLRPGDEVLFKGGEAFSDDTLMPGWGYEVSGTSAARIVFGSFGTGKARLTKGVWLGARPGYPRGPSYLTFTRLILGPRQGFQATADHIRLIGLSIADLASSADGILAEGSHWLIAGNAIDNIGDSGMLLGFSASSASDPPGGDDYQVYGNVIKNTGLDGSLGYGAHGIYVKVADARIFHNTIVNFRDDGVSARYHNAVVASNYIANGSIGIAWYQYDTARGRSRFTGNTIVNTRDAGIFICGVAESCPRPLESFVVTHNRVRGAHGTGLNLQPTLGSYQVGENSVNSLGWKPIPAAASDSRG